MEKTRRAQKELLCSEYPRLAKEAAAVGSFIHYDVAARNFIIRDKKAQLIDFDYCCCDLPLTDLMRLIKRSLKNGSHYEVKINAILNGYQQYRRLTKAEGEVLYALLLFPQKYWRISHRYFYEYKKNDEDYYIKKMENAVTELEKEDCWLNLLKERLEE
jgi:spore coat protein I